jgi:hypothetical protein
VTKAFGERRRREIVGGCHPILEALEDRTVPATITILGVAFDNVPTTGDVGQSMGLPPLVAVPVAADVQASSAVAELFGGQPSFAMFIPVPEFLTPMGTSTVTTSWTGPVTFTNFQVDSGQLNQLASQITLPDGSTPYVSPYLQAVTLQTAPTLDIVHFAIEPLTMDVQGVHVGLSGVDLTMSFADVPGSAFFTGATGTSPITVVSRALDLFAMGLGVTAAKVNDVAGSIALPAPVSTIIQQLSPKTDGIVPIAQYQIDPMQIDGQTISLDLAGGATVDVSASTGPNEMLGNLLAQAMSLENTGVATLDQFRDLIEKNLLSRSPLELVDEILSGFPLESLFADPSLAQDALEALAFAPVTAELLTIPTSQSGTPIPYARGQDVPVGLFSLYERDSLVWYGGFVGSSSYGPGGDRIHLKKDAGEVLETEAGLSLKWDEDPLPEVLPNLDEPVEGDRVRPQPAAEEVEVEAAFRGVPRSWQGTWLPGSTDRSLADRADRLVAEAQDAYEHFVMASAHRLRADFAPFDSADPPRPSVVNLVSLMAVWCLCQRRMWKETALLVDPSSPEDSEDDETETR